MLTENVSSNQTNEIIDEPLNKCDSKSVEADADAAVVDGIDENSCVSEKDVAPIVNEDADGADEIPSNQGKPFTFIVFLFHK